jgi:hypothetical protein
VDDFGSLLKHSLPDIKANPLANEEAAAIIFSTLASEIPLTLPSFFLVSIRTEPTVQIPASLSFFELLDIGNVDTGLLEAINGVEGRLYVVGFGLFSGWDPRAH